MNSTKSILRELTITTKQIDRFEEQKSALKASLLSEGLIDMLVDAILGPFLHMSAVNMRNTPEYKASIAKIKEIDSLQKKLAIKAKKLQDQYDKLTRGDKDSKNTRTLKSTKPLKY